VRSEEAFDHVAEAFLGEDDVEEGTGFGTTPGLRTGSKIFAMNVRDALVVKLPRARCLELVESGEGELLTMGNRTMREWLLVREADPARWVELGGEARAYVRTTT
jgi:hypothetical protein